MNIRQTINALKKSADDRLLEKHGVVSEFGNITDLGRRIQADLIFEGKSGDKASLVTAVQAVEAEEAKAAKKSKK